jgi:hypothetical protein
LLVVGELVEVAMKREEIFRTQRSVNNAIVATRCEGKIANGPLPDCPQWWIELTIENAAGEQLAIFPIDPRTLREILQTPRMRELLGV